MRRALLPAFAAFCLTASASLAATYQTTIDFTPWNLPLTAPTDPALGNRVVLTWETDRTSGLVSETDLQNLTFSLFGEGGLLFRDDVIVSGAPTPIVGLQRRLNHNGIAFRFDLDAFANNPGFGVVLYDNDRDVLQEGSGISGVSYNIFGDRNNVLAYRYVNGSLDVPRSVNNQSFFVSNRTVILPDTIAPVPLPAPLLLLIGGLGILVALRRTTPRALHGQCASV